MSRRDTSVTAVRLFPILAPLLVTALALPHPARAQTVVHLNAVDPGHTVRPGPRPLVSLGENGGPGSELYRVQAALRFPDGRFAVLNAGTNEVRIFADDGSYVRSFGREGKGPGEFTQPDRMFLARGDSLVVWDSGLGRASVLTADSGFARTIALTPAPQMGRLEGIDDQGRLLVVALRMTAGFAAGISRMPESRYLYDATGARLDSLGTSPGMTGVFRRIGQGMQMLRPLIAPTTTYALANGLLWVETGEARRVQVFDLATGGERDITWDGPDLAMKDAWVDAIIEAHLARVSDESMKPQLRASLERRPRPDAIPAVERVITDGSGRGWVKLAAVPGVQGPAVWLVLTPEGSLLARAEIPRSMTLEGVYGRNVLVVERDAMDVEHARLYPLQAG